MAASDTSRLEIQNDVFASMTPGEAIEAALAELEEEENEQNQSTLGGEQEAESNNEDGVRLNYPGKEAVIQLQSHPACYI